MSQPRKKGNSRYRLTPEQRAYINYATDPARTPPKRKAAVERKSASSLPTARQMEVIRLVALGMPQKLIATEMGISIKGVGSHLYNTNTQICIKDKLGFSDPARLTHWAIVHKLVKAGEAL